MVLELIVSILSLTNIAYVETLNMWMFLSFTGILPEEILKKLEAPVSDLLYMLLTCNAKFVENFDVLLHMLLEYW